MIRVAEADSSQRVMDSGDMLLYLGAQERQMYEQVTDLLQQFITEQEVSKGRFLGIFRNVASVINKINRHREQMSQMTLPSRVTEDPRDEYKNRGATGVEVNVNGLTFELDLSNGLNDQLVLVPNFDSLKGDRLDQAKALMEEAHSV